MPKKTFDSQCSSTVRWKSEWQKVNKYVKTTRNKAALKFFLYICRLYISFIISNNLRFTSALC